MEQLPERAVGTSGSVANRASLKNGCVCRRQASHLCSGSQGATMFSFLGLHRSKSTRESRRPEKRRPPSVRLELEPLEDRQLLATIATAGPSEVFVIRPDQSVWQNIGAGWQEVAGPGFAVAICAVNEPALSDFVLFARTSGGTIFQYRSTLGWSVVGSTFTTMSAGTDLNGFADLFALTSGGALYEFSNSGVVQLGNYVTSIAGSINGIVIATLTNNAVWAYDPTLGWFAVSSAGFANQVSVQTDASTGDEVVFANTLGGSVWTWTLDSGWTDLGATFNVISAGQDNSSTANVFALTSGGGLFEFYRDPVRAEFLGSSVSLMAATTDDRVFVVLSNGAVWGHDSSVGWFVLTSPGFAALP
jgi:hypothetical protein